jgi:hypothetical protein
MKKIEAEHAVDDLSKERGKMIVGYTCCRYSATHFTCCGSYSGALGQNFASDNCDRL